jgi:hypothetical protein
MRLHCILFFISVACLAQAPAPVIHFEKTHHDFGRLHQSQKVSHRYKVSNRGTAPLDIIKITPSCGCSYTIAGQWSLKPKENTFIEVGFDPAGMSGSVHKVVDVTSNDPANPKTRLSFEANVMKDIMPSTNYVNFTNVPRKALASSAIRLKSGNEQSIQVESALIPGTPFISCTPQKDGNDVLLNIKFDANQVPKNKYKGSEILTVRTTNKSEPRLQFTIHWNLEAAIEASPSKIHWADTQGKELRASVQLTSASQRSFRILDAKSSSPFLKVVGISNSPATQHQLEVVLSSKANTRALFETIVLKLDDPDQVELEIGVTATLM